MQVSTRSYLTAGMSFVAAGAIIATPMSPLAPKHEPSHRLVGDQQDHLAALTTPRTYPFVAAFIASAVVLTADPCRRREICRQTTAAVIALGAMIWIWAAAAHGGVEVMLDEIRPIVKPAGTGSEKVKVLLPALVATMVVIQAKPAFLVTAPAGL